LNGTADSAGTQGIVARRYNVDFGRAIRRPHSLSVFIVLWGSRRLDWMNRDALRDANVVSVGVGYPKVSIAPGLQNDLARRITRLIERRDHRTFGSTRCGAMKHGGVNRNRILTNLKCEIYQGYDPPNCRDEFADAPKILKRHVCHPTDRRSAASNSADWTRPCRHIMPPGSSNGQLNPAVDGPSPTLCWAALSPVTTRMRFNTVPNSVGSARCGSRARRPPGERRANELGLPESAIDKHQECPIGYIGRVHGDRRSRLP